MPQFMPGVPAIRLLKEALGIALDTPVSRIVLEVDGDRVPNVYVKGPAVRGVVETLAGLFSVVPVADVTVDDQGTVTTQAVPGE